MDDIWKGSEYAVCPKCNQVVRRDDLIRGIHFCQSSIKQWMTLPAVD